MSAYPVEQALEDIAQNIVIAREAVDGLNADDLERDQIRLYAATYALQCISEAVRRLPADLLARHPHMPWPLMKAAGNVYRHDYHLVSPQVIWNTVHRALRPLQEVVDKERTR